jgi:hypothetical protein
MLRRVLLLAGRRIPALIPGRVGMGSMVVSVVARVSGRLLLLLLLVRWRSLPVRLLLAI